MILSVNQPYFAPFPDFFWKARLSDIFIILDNVQFPQGTTWITRNRFKNDKGILWMTVPVLKKGLGLQKIDEVEILYEGQWPRKHMQSLKHAYMKAPYFSDHWGIVETMFSEKIEKIVDLNLEVIGYFLRLLHIDTKIRLLSELGVKGRGDELLIQICRKTGATQFLAQSAARKYLNSDRFQAARIEIKFFRPPALVYPQLWGNFISNLSILDLFFNCGPKAHDILFPDKKALSR
jgi:hypothetical protein